MKGILEIKMKTDELFFTEDWSENANLLYKLIHREAMDELDKCKREVSKCKSPVEISIKIKTKKI